MATTSRIAVMEGTLGEVSLADLLQVISIGRQYTAIELRQEDQSHTATLFIKSGKLISAAGAGARGKEAFLNLFPLPKATTFHVFRTETPSSMPEPIGLIGSLLLEALDRDSDPAPRGEPQTAQLPRPRSAPAITPPIKAAAVTPIRANSRQEMPVPARPLPAPTPPPSAGQPAPLPAPVQARSAARSAPPAPSSRDSLTPRKSAERMAPPFVLAVASPKGGCGKTTVALNLALSLARRGHGVVLVDGDANGDVMSSIDARGQSRAGTFDVLAGKASLDEALLATVIPQFKIMPACGVELPDAAFTLQDHGDDWRGLLSTLKARTEFVIVDTPAGMLGMTHQILRNATHVLGVLQAEVLAQRSFSMFTQGLDALPEPARPRVLGVVLNMVQPAHPASVTVLQRACSTLPREWLFESSIPRSPSFLEASEEGLPLRLLDEQSPPAVSFLFDMLAAEVVDRLQLGAPERRAQRLLV
jgi:cellulose biosynthesis protein BcsQ